jgi:hypothetical protein
MAKRKSVAGFADEIVYLGQSIMLSALINCHSALADGNQAQYIKGFSRNSKKANSESLQLKQIGLKSISNVRLKPFVFEPTFHRLKLSGNS